MQYASKIHVNYNPQIIYYDIKVDLGYDSELTIAELRLHGVTDDNSFQILEDDITKKCTLYIHCKRLETLDEVSLRVEKEINYNKSYDEFHLKHKKI